MTRDISPDIGKIRLLLTEPHDCSYLDNHLATTAFVDPEIEIDAELYGRMSAMGFRRSGLYLYSPLCSACNACVPARIPVNQFRSSRSQKRCLKRNEDIAVKQVRNISFDQHYPIYDRYISGRHFEGDMFPPSQEQFEQFLGNAWDCSRFLEFSIDEQLIGCAVVDQLPNALSAIYTYFDPHYAERSLGTLAVLLQIQLAQQMGLEHLYLGYWIADCQKMNYKTKYQPLELLQENTWRLSALRALI
ncbi:arginyltransferase [Porticoccaceae bacterium]|jgi:arginine-tRNA-protein transferase|nr:arginyltransferase [Porticoccaceae bacterium]